MTLITGHPHGRNCICESCLSAIGLTRTLRIVEPDGTEHYARMALDAKAHALEHILELMGQHIVHCNATRCPGHRLADRASCDETVQLIMDADHEARRQRLIEEFKLTYARCVSTRLSWNMLFNATELREIIDLLEHSK